MSKHCSKRNFIDLTIEEEFSKEQPTLKKLKTEQIQEEDEWKCTCEPDCSSPFNRCQWCQENDEELGDFLSMTVYDPWTESKLIRAGFVLEPIRYWDPNQKNHVIDLTSE